MGIQVIDTFKQIEEYKRINNKFMLKTWKEYTDKISPSLYQLCYSDSLIYNLSKDVIPIINNALYNHFELVSEAHNSFVKIINSLDNRIKEAFNINIDLTLVFYLGLCNGAGWAIELDGKQTILLGIEKIVELRWQDFDTMTDLICHEIVHLIHFKLRGNIENPYESIYQLYIEGFATRFSQKMNKEGYYHQDKEGWLNFCLFNKSKIKKEYLNRLNKHMNTKDFFGDWNSVMRRSNLGYFLGSEYIRFLETRFDYKSIACMSAEDIEKNLYLFLEE